MLDQRLDRIYDYGFDDRKSNRVQWDNFWLEDDTYGLLDDPYAMEDDDA